jgi:hypothetical protein
MSTDTSPAARRGAVLALTALGLIAVLAMPAQAATDKPGAAAPGASAGTSGAAKPQGPAKSGTGLKAGGQGTAPGSDCSAGAGTKIPSWPKCPGGQKPKVAGGS